MQKQVKQHVKANGSQNFLVTKLSHPEHISVSDPKSAAGSIKYGL